ncbi:MAG: CPBP family intramembrane metalloprotease [Acidobacteria bacterium]|nr:CPBP family intramembrane metalloprotease [Acidobacteriota bacterium]
MQETGKASSSFASRPIAAAIEILTVALAGSLAASYIFRFSGIAASDIIQDTRLLFAFLLLEAVVTLLLITLFLLARRESFVMLGFSFQGFLREARIGVLTLSVLLAATVGVGAFFRMFLPQFVTETNPLLELVKTPSDLMLFMLSSVFVGGIKEEIQRAFVLVRFERHLGGIIVGLILWSIFFGVGHQAQGVDKAAGAGVLGFIFGLLFVWRRKLTAPIVAHALYDIFTLLLFWNYYAKIPLP